MKIPNRIGVEYSWKRFTPAVICLLCCVWLTPALPAQDQAATPDSTVATKPAAKTKKKKAPKPRPKPADDNAEAAEVSAITEKYRVRRQAAQDQGAAKVRTYTQAPVPKNKEDRQKWRDGLRESLKAERDAAAKADDDMRSELDTAVSKRHPEAKDEP